MGLTSAMFTGLSGLHTNQLRIDTIGDNIANVNTTAFKGSQASFQNQFAVTLSGGTGPNGASGGTNPAQVGRGSMLGSIQRNFTPGPLEATGVPTDLAIEGQGFFVVNGAGNQQAYTRDGMFKLDADNTLVTADGFHVQGYGVDSNFNIVPGTLGNLQIPLGALSAARATSRAGFDGNLKPNGAVATHGTILNSQALLSAPDTPATQDTRLTSLFSAGSPAIPLFGENDVLTLSGIRKGGREVPETTFTVGANTTIGEFLAFLNDTIGINQEPGLPGSPGIRLSDTGAIVVEGNAGLDNALEIPASAIRSTNLQTVTPFGFTEQQAAVGESVFTTFTAYDSLGTPVQVNLTLTLDSRSNAGNTWRFFAESADDTDASRVLGPTGTLTFDTNGRLIAVTNDTVQVNRAGLGTVDPLAVKLDFAKVTGLTTQSSTMVMTNQDGYGTGALTSFSVGTDGLINGTFSNGLNRQLGQLALATFTNPGGLVAGTNNLFLVGPNSGQPIITSPDTLGAGRIIGGALELSNVDLTREFIGLITATTGFSASGRVISTSNDLLNELLLIAR